jgi:hypothetical protein
LSLRASITSPIFRVADSGIGGVAVSHAIKAEHVAELEKLVGDRPATGRLEG